MNATARRRLALEILEARLPLDAAGVGPDEPAWAQVIVSLRDESHDPRVAAQQVLAPLSGRLGHVYEHALRGFSAQVPARAVAGLAHHPLIAEVETDLVMQAFQQTLPTGVDRIDAELNGTGGLIGGGKAVDVDIAVIDTGIAPHDELNVVGGFRFSTITSGPPKLRGAIEDGNFADDNGHGTHVAGIAAAKDDGQGVVGVAPGARLWAVKVLDSSGSGFMSDIIKGVDWVTERAAEIEIANMSLGGVGQSTLLHQSIQASVAAGVVYVVAAGNDWGDIHGADGTYQTSDDTIPAAYPEVATISAFADSDGQPGGLGPATSWGQYGLDDGWWGPSNFSNGDGAENGTFLAENPVTSPGLGIDLALPGVDIRSTSLRGGYETLSGTSMAAPHAAGLAALHIAQHGRAYDASGVVAIRQALIDGGQAWSSEQGLANSWGPDRHAENIGWAGGVPSAVAPAVAILSPTETLDGDPARVAGSVEVTATAEAFGDGVSVREVTLSVDGTIVDTVTAPDETGNFALRWDTFDTSGEPLYADGVYTLNVTATDSLGQTGSKTVSVLLDNVADPPVAAIQALLSGTATQINRNFWQASATVTVVDSGGAPQPGAVVTGRWVETGAVVTGTSDASGRVSFDSGNLRNLASIDFTVEAIELAGFEYTESSSIRIFESGGTTVFASGLAAPLAPRVDATESSDDTWRSVPLADSVDRVMAGDELYSLVARRGSQAPPPRSEIRLLREDSETPDAPNAHDLEASFLTSENDL